jgi:hypothetical protein
MNAKHGTRHENRLANETSPYLLQHAHNPVDWYPWSEEAFEKARAEDKPMFISIGYSTCHWCHVMAHESFEDEATAELLNDLFVAIKVDREERPDIDTAYMNFVVSSTGTGGWPMSVFATPDGKPFFGGTYFPAKANYGMPAFKDVLKSVATKYRDEREAVISSADRIASVLQESLKKRWDENAPGELDAKPVYRFNADFIGSFDEENGGTMGAPKFPITLNILFNLYQRKSVAESLFTLRAMAGGGIHDHLGGGFHRYSTDERWIVPHFEKMLYDNGLLLEAYSKAYLVSGEAVFKQAAEGIFRYLNGTLATPDGFYGAQDADSEGVEGKYYVFTIDEVKAVVSHFDLVKRYFHVSKQGNFEGKNILTVDAEQPATFADEELEFIHQDADALREYRDQRVRPRIDTKIVTAWNGLAMSGLAWFSIAFDQQDALEQAMALGRRFIETMVDQKRVVRIVGKDSIPGFLDDHACLANAFLDLYQASGDSMFLDAALEVTRSAIEQFHDGNGHFAESGSKNEQLFVSDTRVQDGVTPSGTSMLAWVAFRLGEIAEDDAITKLVDLVLKAHYPALLSRSTSMTLMVQTLDAVTGDHSLVSIPRTRYDSDIETRNAILKTSAFNKSIRVIDAKTSKIIACQAGTCRTYDNAEDVLAELSKDK